MHRLMASLWIPILAASVFVAAGTPIQLIKTGFEGAEGPVGTISTFVEHSNESHGLAFDPQGRLISVQRAPKNQKVGVLYPPDKVAVLAERYDGTPFHRLNDIVVDKGGRVLLGQHRREFMGRAKWIGFIQEDS
jgi:sugar lactone lactonase YvrE